MSNSPGHHPPLSSSPASLHCYSLLFLVLPCSPLSCCSQATRTGPKFLFIFQTFSGESSSVEVEVGSVSSSLSSPVTLRLVSCSLLVPWSLTASYSAMRSRRR